MSECALCGKSTSFISVRCASGSVCVECMSDIPSVAKPYIKELHSTSLKIFIKRWRQNKKKYTSFTASSSYGMLHIDEIRGLIAICDRKEIKNDRLPDKCRDVFSIFDIEDYSITVESISTSPDSVKVEIKFICILRKPELQFVKVINTAICYVERVGDGKITYREPPDLTLFRSIMWQTICNVRKKFEDKERQHFLTPEAVALTKARALFMLGDYYDEHELRKQRNRLIKVFHPDEELSGEDMTPYMNRINAAFRLLKEDLDDRKI